MTRRKSSRPSDKASRRAQSFASQQAKTLQREEQQRRDRAAAAEADFQSQIATTRLNIYQLADGDDATRVLAALAVVIGTPAEAGARTYGREPAWIRQLHGALRAVVDMCLQGGYRWRADMADALDRAVELASAPHEPLPIDHYTEAWKEANALAVQILNHKVSPGAVA